MASAEREPITGVWRRTLPLQKLVGFVSISAATSSKSGVDMSTRGDATAAAAVDHVEK